MGFIENFFGKKDIPDIPEYDFDKAVRDFLLTLPRCSKNLIIVSPDHGETDYTCKVVVDARSLLPWAEHEAESVTSSFIEEQVARISLPIWLRDYDEADTSYSEIHYYMYKVLRPYVSNFISENMAKVYCLECSSFVSDIKMEKKDEKGTQPWAWTDIWSCPKGHRLYHEKHELHINMG